MKDDYMLRCANFYVQQCGFLIVPLRPQSKWRAIKGTYFDSHVPEPRHLESWFLKSKRQYGIGIVPGEVSKNLVVLDFDEFGSFGEWYKHTHIETPRVISKRGTHVYVRLGEVPKNGKGRFQGKIFGDIVCHGNITAPPSIHPSGHRYRWDGDPRDIPFFSCLAELGVERIPPPTSSTQQRKPRSPIEGNSGAGCYGVNVSKIKNKAAYVQAAVRSECQKLSGLSPKSGVRNHTLYRAALNLAKFLDLVPQSTIEFELKRAAEACGMTETEDSISPTILSGFRNGARNGVLQA